MRKKGGPTEACDKSIVSKMRLMTADICMTSPLIRHSFLLSSRTVFMFSIHIASIGPSNTTHLRSGVVKTAYSRNVFAVMPSDHCVYATRNKTVIGDSFVRLIYAACSLVSRLSSA